MRRRVLRVVTLELVPRLAKIARAERILSRELQLARIVFRGNTAVQSPVAVKTVTWEQSVERRQLLASRAILLKALSVPMQAAVFASTVEPEQELILK